MRGLNQRKVTIVMNGSFKNQTAQEESLCQAQLHSVVTPCQYYLMKQKAKWNCRNSKKKPPRQTWKAWLSLQIAKQLQFLIVSAMSTLRVSDSKEILCLWHKAIAWVYICRGYCTLSVFPTVTLSANSDLSCDKVSLLKLPHHLIETGRVSTSLRDLEC